MKRLRKNKFLVLSVCVVIVSCVYFGAQKAIDSYVFNTNSDIVSENSNSDGNGKEKSTESESSESNDSDGRVAGNPGDGESEEPKDGSGQISDEEIDLVLEESEEDAGGADTSASEGVGEDSGAGDGHGEGNVAGEDRDGNDFNDSEGAAVEENKIYVYITGEVNNPGVVILNEGSRIVDAINAAGGTTIKANVSKVNLVYVLDDGMKVNIPNNNDLKENPNFEYITMNSGDGGRDDYWDDSSDGESSSGGESAGTGSGSYKNYSIVNINTATQTELETLPGIGPSLALNIINYRKENGRFSSVEEIKSVSGIGESKFEKLKSYITI